MTLGVEAFWASLSLNQGKIDTVQGDATVVADERRVAIAIGQAGDDVSGTASAHLGGVHVKDAGVVGLAVEGVVLDTLGVDLIAVLGRSLHGDANTAVDVQGALERLIGLKTNDGLALGVSGVDVASGVAHDTGNGLGIHVEHAALLALLEEQSHDVVPQLGGALGGTDEERLVALVGGVVLLDKVADVNLVQPIAAFEAFPCLLHFCDHSPRVNVARVGGAREYIRTSMYGKTNSPTHT